MVESEGIPQKKWCALQKKRERKRKNYSKNGVLHQNQNSPLPHSAKSSSLFQNVNILKLCVLSHSVVSDSLRPDGLWPARLLCPWGFSRQEYWNGLLCPPPGDLPDSGFEPTLTLMSPALAGGFFTTSAILVSDSLQLYGL